MSRKIVKTVIEERQVDGWDHLRDRIRVALGNEPLDEWSWYKKPDEQKPAPHFGKVPHFSDAYYKPRTGSRKRSSPNIHAISTVPVYADTIVLASSDAPVARPAYPMKTQVKKVVKQKTVEPEVETKPTEIGEYE